jgi:hypothetical protein
MGVNHINFLNLKTKLRISSKEAAVHRSILYGIYFLVTLSDANIDSNTKNY